MFRCLKRCLHADYWAIPLSFGSSTSSNSDCFLCILNYISSTSITTVQKQVSLKIVLAALEHEEKHIVMAMCQDMSVAYQIIDVCRDLHSEEHLRDLVCTVCTLAVDKLQQDVGYTHLLETFKEGVDTLNENWIQFCMTVVSALLRLHIFYVDSLLLSNAGYILVKLLENAELMEEKMTVSLIQLLMPVVKRINDCAELDEQGYLMETLLPLLIMWLNKSQSLQWKRSILLLLEDVLNKIEPVVCLLSYGMPSYDTENTDDHNQVLTPQDSPFLMGLKRMMTSKDAVLTSNCVHCLTQILRQVNESKHISQIMGSDIPEFVFQSLYTTDGTQLDAIFTCLQMFVNTDEFFQRCHAVYGIDATLSAVKGSIDSQRLSSAHCGLHLLWCLLDRQPETMPLFLNHSWTSCYQVIYQALQHGNNTIYLSGLQAATAFLSPKHQQSHVDIKAILSLIGIAAPKSQSLLNNQEVQLQQAYASVVTEQTDTQYQSLILQCLMGIVTHITSLFQSKTILPGNDEKLVSELRHAVQAAATNIIVSKNFIKLLRDPLSVDKYLKSVDACMYIQSDDEEKQANCQQSVKMILQEKLQLLVKSGLPWLILASVSPHRCPSLESQASKVVVYILIVCMESLPPALYVDPNLLVLGLTHLEWTETGLNLDQVSTQREALLVKMVLLYFSYLHGFRPWPVESLDAVLHQVFYQFPSFLSWHPLILRCTIYLMAISEDPLEQSKPEQQIHESELLRELERTSLELWYTDCAEVLIWTLSSQTRSGCIGAKAVEYWLHQLTLTDQVKEEIEGILPHFDGCLPFFQYVIDLLGSHAVGMMAQSVLMQAVYNECFDDMREEILQCIHGKLAIAFSQTPDIDETSVDNILFVLSAMIELRPESLSNLQDVKLVCQCAKYFTQQKSESVRWMILLKYFASLVQQLSEQESKIVIPPLMQNKKFVTVLTEEVSNTNPTVLSSILKLCAWLATYGVDYQASNPLILSTNFLLSSLATCHPSDTFAILQLIRSVFVKSHSGHDSGAAVFVRSHQTFFSHCQTFNDLEIRQLYFFLQQYLCQGVSKVKKLSLDILQKILAINTPSAHQLLHSPWNSILLENTLTMKADSGFSQNELRLWLMLSTSDEIWSMTSANSFLLALTNSNLDDVDIQQQARAVFDVMKSKIKTVDPELLDEAEKCLDSVSSDAT